MGTSNREIAEVVWPLHRRVTLRQFAEWQLVMTEIGSATGVACFDVALLRRIALVMLSLSLCAAADVVGCVPRNSFLMARVTYLLLRRTSCESMDLG